MTDKSIFDEILAYNFSVSDILGHYQFKCWQKLAMLCLIAELNEQGFKYEFNPGTLNLQVIVNRRDGEFDSIITGPSAFANVNAPYEYAHVDKEGVNEPIGFLTLDEVMEIVKRKDR